MEEYPAADARQISKPQIPNSKSAFTLVELLVVITIIGLLIALLLPAVQAAREAARRTQCANNIKQLALGCISHAANLGFFPTGGGLGTWVGDPDLGFTNKQIGGWLFNVLPYIEQQALHDLGAGLTDTAKKPLFAQREQTPLAVMNCPTRRRPAARRNRVTDTPNCGPLPTAAKGDYTANVGEGDAEYQGPGSGVCFFKSMITAAAVFDGLSNTYLLGEKSLTPDSYEIGTSGGDDDQMYGWGANRDTVRSTNASYLLGADRPGADNSYQFGSAHVSGFAMALCDGSVRWINYSINPETHRCLGNRKDGQVIDISKF